SRRVAARHRRSQTVRQPWVDGKLHGFCGTARGTERASAPPQTERHRQVVTRHRSTARRLVSMSTLPTAATIALISADRHFLPSIREPASDLGQTNRTWSAVTRTTNPAGSARTDSSCSPYGSGGSTTVTDNR